MSYCYKYMIKIYGIICSTSWCPNVKCFMKHQRTMTRSLLIKSDSWRRHFKIFDVYTFFSLLAIVHMQEEKITFQVSNWKHIFSNVTETINSYRGVLSMDELRVVERRILLCNLQEIERYRNVIVNWILLRSFDPFFILLKLFLYLLLY